VLASRVVVGDPGHPTPVLEALIRALVLNPAWTIPESIVAGEILPELHRNPGYLLEHDIVLLDRLDIDPYGLSVVWSGLSAGGPLPRLQQRPGPTNPLGRIKFDLPNRFDVHLHDTPATALFAHPVRTRSHGCVRVERAVELAAHLLAGQDLGDRDALERALAAGATRWVPVDRPMPVYLLYWTAFVEEGTLHFRDDVYGRDRRLAIALGDAEAPAAAGPAPAASIAGCASRAPGASVGASFSASAWAPSRSSSSDRRGRAAPLQPAARSGSETSTPATPCTVCTGRRAASSPTRCETSTGCCGITAPTRSTRSIARCSSS
jgi:hypothetical protein